MSEVTLYNTAALDREEWRELQTVARDAFGASLDRPQAEIDELVAWHDHDLFYATHVDPNLQVGGRYTDNQSFSKPRVAVATNGGKPIGFAYSAHNVSGPTELARFGRRLSVVKNYLWIRNVCVLPGQSEEVTRDLGAALLRDAIPFQPVTAYIWPGENDTLQPRLEKLGFTATGTEPVKVFGKDSDPIDQVRMQARTAAGVLKKL